MASPDLPRIDPRDVPEPGAELEAKLARIEGRIREQLAGAGALDSVVSVSAREVLLLVACIRELLRDRDALLEEIDALECAAGRPQGR